MDHWSALELLPLDLVPVLSGLYTPSGGNRKGDREIIVHADRVRSVLERIGIKMWWFLLRGMVCSLLSVGLGKFLLLLSHSSVSVV